MEVIMSEQALIQFRADKNLKEEVTQIYEQLGLDLPTAFRMFMARTKLVRGLPFELTLPEETKASNPFEALRAEATDVPELSLEEINREIEETRKTRRARKS